MAEFDYMESVVNPVLEKTMPLSKALVNPALAARDLMAKKPEPKKIESDADYDALEAGAAFIDPEGKPRIKSYTVKQDSDYEAVPEGATFLDPEGQTRTKPKYQGIDFTAQTLYDMAVNIKEKRKALERSYPGKVKEDEHTGELYVDDNGTLRKPKGFAEAPVESLTGQVLPIVGSMIGESVGAKLGSRAGPVGVIPGSVAGGGIGAAGGQAFNDVILQLAGVYDRTSGEEVENLGEAAAFGAGGTAVGRAVAGVFPKLRGYARSLPGMAARFLGASSEALETAIPLAEKGVMIPPSTVFKEAPHLQNIAEVFDPAFRTQKPMLQSATKYYEEEAGQVLKDLGVEPPASLVDPTTAPSTQKAGEALLQKRLAASQEADRALDEILAKRQALLQGEEPRFTPTGPTKYTFTDKSLGAPDATFEQFVEGGKPLLKTNEAEIAAIEGLGDKLDTMKDVTKLVVPNPNRANYNHIIYAKKGQEKQAARLAELFGNPAPKDAAFHREVGRLLGYPERDIDKFIGMTSIEQTAAQSRKAATDLIQSGFDDIQRDVDGAMKVAKAGSNSGDLWWNVGEKLKAVRQGIGQRAKIMYDQADSVAGDVKPNISGLPELAQSFLDQLPEGFEGQYPGVIKRIRDLAGELGENGEIVKEPVVPTFGQLHELRTVLRSNYNRLDLTPDIKQGAFKFFANRVDQILNAPGATPELKAAAKLLREADSWYAENMGPLNDRRIQAVMDGLDAGLPADPKVLFDTLVKEGRSELTKKVADLIGPNLWAGVKAADVQEMLDLSKGLVPGEIDGKQFARQVLSRHRNNMLEAVHGEEAAGKLLKQAQNIEMLEGRIPITARPGDTATDVISRARQAAEAAKLAAKQDPLKTLAQEAKKAESGFRKELAQKRAQDPLGFIYDPTVGASEAVNTILGKEDLILAAAARFGADSPEFNMLRQVWAQRILQGTMEPSGKLAKFSPEVQQIMFPGATLDQMRTLAKNMDFLLASRGTEKEAARGMAAMAKVEHPWASILGRGGAFAKLLTSPTKLIPGADATGRAMLSKYYELVTTLVGKPGFLRWVQRGLEGDEAARQMTREAVRAAMDKGGLAGAAIGESQYQAQNQ